MTNNDRKWDIQEAQYEFPYHYIPTADPNGQASLLRKMGWGLEYLCYQRTVREFILRLAPRSVLEVGCGDGYLIGSLPVSIPHRVGVDPSSSAIALAKALNPHCEFFAVSAGQIDQQYDLVVAVEVLEHIADDQVSSFLRDISERTSPGGRAILTVPTTNLPLNKKHYRHYDISLFSRQLAESGCALHIEEVTYVYRDTFLSAVVRRLVQNRFCTVEIPWLTKLAWRAVSSRHRIVGPDQGHHMLLQLKKQPE